MANSQLNSITLAIFLLSVGLLVASTSARSRRFSYCDKKADYPVKVRGVDVSPYPVIFNQQPTFTIAATTNEPISGGKLVIDFTFYVNDSRSQTIDLCNTTSCPVSAEDFQIVLSQVLPEITPPGPCWLKMTLVDDNKNLTCIKFDFWVDSLNRRL